MRRFITSAYAVVALGTFGVAAHTYQRDAWARYSVCESVAADVSDRRIVICREPWQIDAPVVGLVSGALWPLYWTWAAADLVLEKGAN